MTGLQSLLDTLPHLTPDGVNLISRAYQLAESKHAGQKRKSGDPYFTHCVEVAKILADMKLDAEAVAAALMHDLVEDTDYTLDEMGEEFGDTVAAIVDGVTKLDQLPFKVESNRRGRNSDRELEYIRKMLLAMGDDVRIVLVKLADRLHNMRTLDCMPPEKQERKARETMEIFAPLANRLGIWQIKWELEDLSLRYLEPEAYESISDSIDEHRPDREAYLANVVQTLRAELRKYGIDNATISGRPKHIYSIYKKMQRKALPFEQIYDVRAVRVIVDTIPQCYLVLGVVHNLWRPIPGEFDDYIAAPKDNFYQSLHTAILDSRGKTIEVQIRTWDMHEHAEYGIAAHWRYKEGTSTHDDNFERRLSYLRRLMEFGQDEVGDDAESFVDHMKTEVFQDRVYAFTPKGDIIDLPAGATPIDFAYHIHTEIGHKTRGAKIHGRLVGLNYQLKTGDQVEIVTDPKRNGPSLDWLNPDLGYVNTSRARTKVRHWFRKQNRDKHIVMGREVLERELKRLGLSAATSFDSVAQLLGYDKVDDFLATVGAGDINSATIANRILEAERRTQQEANPEAPLKIKPKGSPLILDPTNGINIMGMKGLLVNIAQCCKPVPSDDVVGYITRGRGITVHRQDCANVLAYREHDNERLVEVAWEDQGREQRYSVPVEIVAYDREGLMRDISTIVSEEQINMSTIHVSTRQNIATFQVTMEIINVQQLTRIISKLERVPSVVEAYRRNMA
jgi:RelA/SpoT family (p)ppGpp synthetase